MSTLELGVAAGTALAGLIAILWLRGLLKRQLSGKTDGAARAPANGAEAPLIERRVSAVERAQAEIVGRLDDMAETGASEERMQAMASSLVGLIRDKNAAMETALAGLDQLRARLGTLEKIGDMAEARALFDGMAERLEALEAGRKETEAAFGTRLAALTERLEGDGGPAAALAARLEKLHERKDAGLAAMMARLEPLEKRLDRIETGMKALPDEAAGRVEGRIGEIARLQSDVQAELAALRARADSATAPFAEISEQLTRLYAQKDSTTEAMLARLAPLEAKLGELEAEMGARDPQDAIAGLADRIERLRDGQGDLAERLASASAAAAEPYGALSERVAELAARAEAASEEIAGRIAPLAERLAALEARGLEDEAAARAEAEEIAEQLIAMREAADRTALFADRIAMLETSLPRLTMAQSLMMEALERRAAEGQEPAAAEAAPPEAAETAPETPAAPPHPAETPEPAVDAGGEIDDIWNIPRVVSMHKG
jgi:DNA repair exonuclease SbcCD ATPase subunit